ncbi:MAG: undecaprenyl-diphosphate phosphatase [Thiohalomonadaceae bacterium]
MELIQIIVLAILQGLTEFLPISSSAHLILLGRFGDWPDQGLAFDVSVHVGTLLAVIWYFRHDLQVMTRDWFSSLGQRKNIGESRLAWAVLFGTIPVGLAGLLFKGIVENELRSPLAIAWATVIFAPLLLWADIKGRGQRSEHAIGWKDVFVIGVAQAIALIPGASRSGITMTAGLMLGLSRSAAARFSFLLSIPVIVLAGGLHTVELIRESVLVDWNSLLLGVMISGVFAYMCIHLFLKWLERTGMLPFVIYRLLLGAGLLYFFS